MATRIAIVGGGGGVGSSLAFNLLLRPEPYEVGLVDGQSGMARSHEMDLQQVRRAAAPSGSIARRPGPTTSPTPTCVVVTAAAPLTVNRSRHGLPARQRADPARGDRPRRRRRAGRRVVVVTNPVDPLCTWLQRDAGSTARRVLGYTLNDSLRLRTAIGDGSASPAHRVDAWVIGEHGDACVPLLDRVRVDGEPVSWRPSSARAAEDFVRNWYIRHVALDSGRSSTWTSGHVIARMVAALLGPPTASRGRPRCVLDGEYGIEGVALTVPVTLGPRRRRARSTSGS